MTLSPVVLALTDAMQSTADALQAAAQALLQGTASNVTGERLLLLAGPLLAELATVEREAHRLKAFAVRPPPAS